MTATNFRVGRPFKFAVGDRVYDKRDHAKGVVVEQRRHTNNSPKYLIQWESEQMRTMAWEVDLRPLEDAP